MNPILVIELNQDHVLCMYVCRICMYVCMYIMCVYVCMYDVCILVSPCVGGSKMPREVYLR